MVLKLETTALIYSSVALILFVFPYFMYAKELTDKSQGQSGDYFQIIGKIVGIHLTMIFFTVAFTSIIDIMMSFRDDMSPSEGLKLFFNAGGKWEDLITYLVTFTGKATSDNGNIIGNSSIEAYRLVMNYYGVAVAMFMAMIPIMVVSISIGAMLSESNQNQTKKSVGDKVFVGSFMFAAVTFLVWFHALLASAYVSIFTGINFSWYKIMSSFWHLILIGE